MNLKVVLLFPMILISGMAHAHAHLEKATPADNAVLTDAPAKVVLEFSEAARLTSLSIKKEGENVGTKLQPLPKEAAASLAMPLANLTPGKYVVDWRVVGDDNHIMAGKLHFEVKSK